MHCTALPTYDVFANLLLSPSLHMQTRNSPKLSKTTSSTNGQTNGSPLNSQPSPVASSSKEFSGGSNGITTTIQSPQGSQGSSSSEGATPVHTAVVSGNASATVATAGDGDGGERTPIPPPRRKRKTRKRTQQASKESEASGDVLSPDESVSGSSSGPKSPDPHTPSQDRSHDWSHDPAPSVSTHSDQSHDLASGDVSSQSPDPFSEDDHFPHESVDGFNSSFKMAKALTLERSSLSIAGSNSDAPSSRTSVLATVDSSSNGGQRPYSVLVSPYDINAHFNFPEESSNRIGGLVTLPRGGAQTWSARSSLVSKRQSQRSMQFPSSSMLASLVPMFVCRLPLILISWATFTNFDRHLLYNHYLASHPLPPHTHIHTLSHTHTRMHTHSSLHSECCCSSLFHPLCSQGPARLPQGAEHQAVGGPALSLSKLPLSQALHPSPQHVRCRRPQGTHGQAFPP